MNKWETKTIKDIVDSDRPVTYGVVQPGEFVSNGVPLIRGQDYSSGRISYDQIVHITPEIAAPYRRSIVHEGDILFSIVGYLGKCAEVPSYLSGAQITQTTARIAIKKSINSKYVLHYFKSSQFESQVKKWTKGSAQPGLNLGDVEKMLIQLPPLVEQKKIAEILSAVDRVIDTKSHLLQKLALVKKEAMDMLCFKSLKKNTKWVPLKNCISGKIRDFGSFSSTTQIEFLNSGIPFIKSEQIFENKVDLKNVFYISEVVHKNLNKSFVKPDTVLLAKIGSALGKAAFYEGELGECNSNAATAKIVTDHTKLMPKFLVHYLNSSIVQKMLRDKVISLPPRINLGDLDELPIPLLDLNEQKRTTTVIDSIYETYCLISEELEKTRILKAALMDDLLSGRVRVKA